MPQTHGARGELRVRDVENQQARIVRQIGVPYAAQPDRTGAPHQPKPRSRPVAPSRSLQRQALPGRRGRGRQPAPYAAFYTSLINAERRALESLAKHLPAEIEVDEIYERYRNWGAEESA